MFQKSINKYKTIAFSVDILSSFVAQKTIEGEPKAPKLMKQEVA